LDAGNSAPEPGGHLVLKLLRASRNGGRAADPDNPLYLRGESDGYAWGLSQVRALLNAQRLKDHLQAQYNFGYYDGLARALRDWADRLAADRLIELPDDD
jgi:hypothetical protein